MVKQVLPPPADDEEVSRFDEKWRKCPQKSCRASFDADPDLFIISGDGDWLNTIVCKRCGHTRMRVPDEVLAQLLSEKWWDAGALVHVTYDHCLEFIQHRRKWWERRTSVEETLT